MDQKGTSESQSQRARKPGCMQVGRQAGKQAGKSRWVAKRAEDEKREGPRRRFGEEREEIFDIKKKRYKEEEGRTRV